MRKNIIPLAIVVGSLTATTLCAAPHRTLPPRLTLNDYTFTRHAVQKANTVFVPVREIARKLALHVTAGPHGSTVLQKNGYSIMRITAGSHYGVVNGKPRAFAIAPYRSRGALMVPVRAISEAAGAVVGYAASPRTVQINYKAAPVSGRAALLTKRAAAAARQPEHLGSHTGTAMKSTAGHAGAAMKVAAGHAGTAARHIQDGASDAVNVNSRRPWWLFALGVLAIILILAALRARKKKTIEVLPPPPPPEEPVIRQYP